MLTKNIYFGQFIRTNINYYSSTTLTVLECYGGYGNHTNSCYSGSRNFIFMKQWIMQWLTLKNGWHIWAQITITIPIGNYHKRPDGPYPLPVCSNAIMKLPSVSIRVTVIGGWIVRDCQGLTKMWGSGCAGN